MNTTKEFVEDGLCMNIKLELGAMSLQFKS